jgi:hypothetical protein
MRLLNITPKGHGGGGKIVGVVLNYLKDKVVTGELDPDDSEGARKIVLSKEWDV